MTINEAVRKFDSATADGQRQANEAIKKTYDKEKELMKTKLVTKGLPEKY